MTREWHIMLLPGGDLTADQVLRLQLFLVNHVDWNPSVADVKQIAAEVRRGFRVSLTPGLLTLEDAGHWVRELEGLDIHCCIVLA